MDHELEGTTPSKVVDDPADVSDFYVTLPNSSERSCRKG